MESLAFRNYRTIIPNEFYGRPTEELIHNVRGPLQATECMRLGRFYCHTPDEVVGHITDLAKTLKGKSSGQTHGSEVSSLTELLLAIGDEHLGYLASREPKLLNIYRFYCPTTKNQSSQYHLQAEFGSIPNMVLEEARTMRLQKPMDPHDAAMAQAASREWALTVRLEDGLFPPRDELDYLLRRRVRQSDVFTVNDDDDDPYTRVVEIMGILSSALSTKELVSQVPDYSSRVLENRAKNTIVAVANKIAIRSVMSGLAQMLQSAEEDQEPDGSGPFRQNPRGRGNPSLH
jgi:hypothetical protein